MRRPPPPVMLVARSHWLVGLTVGGAIVLLHMVTRGLPIAFSPKAYAITGSLGTLFLVTGTLVWFGLPPGRALSRVCVLLYLIRPPLYFELLAAMKLPEFQAHFARRA